MTDSKAVELLKNNEERRTAGTYIVVKHLSIIALEKQIPKKPKSITPVENSMYVKCPTCKLTTVLYDGCIMEYCKNCGQKLDWSDDE